MPPRKPGQPTRVMDHYRDRLAEEMKAHGYTDRTLAEAMTQAGHPVPHTAIFKTRSGSRQPSLDECATVAWVFGYPGLTAFLEGPASIALARWTWELQTVFEVKGMELRAAVTHALRMIDAIVTDPASVADLDQREPGWRDEYRIGLARDLRFIFRDQVALWGETNKQLDDMFGGEPIVLEDDRDSQRRGDGEERNDAQAQ